MRIAYSKVQIKRIFFHKSLVVKRLWVNPGSRSLLARQLGLPLHMLTVITLEPINSCPVALPSAKGFGWGLARSSLASWPILHIGLLQVLLLTRLIRILTLPLPFYFRYHGVEMFIRTEK